MGKSLMLVNAQGNTLHCVMCQKEMFLNTEDAKPSTQGEICSQAGLREVSISGTCEYCFDALFEGMEDDDADAPE